jgi:hypothetical protein
MEKRAPEAIAARDKLHENNDSQALWTFNNQNGTRGFYFDYQPVFGVGAVRRIGAAVVDRLGEKKAPTEIVSTNLNPIPVAVAPRPAAAPLPAQYGMFDVLGIDRCSV